jgi:hypothetical protein
MFVFCLHWMPAEQVDPHGILEPAIFAHLKSGKPPQDSYYPGCALSFDCYCTVSATECYCTVSASLLLFLVKPTWIR